MTKEELIWEFTGPQPDGYYMTPLESQFIVEAAIQSRQIKEDPENLGYYDVTGIGYPGGEALGG
jgi:hypothetical protein